METKTIRIALNGVTGRMGTNQHLLRSLCAIAKQGGVKVGSIRIIPEMLLVGRSEQKLQALMQNPGVIGHTTDLDTALGDSSVRIYFDAQTTGARYDAVKRAIAAGKHVYCEKPAAASSAQALELHRLTAAASIIGGVVQDKLWLPGLRKLKRLIDQGWFGTILDVRGEFGYWVFAGGDGDQPPQRPSWNYRLADGGGIISDMLAHWDYLIGNLFGRVTKVCSTASTLIPQRFGEDGQPYTATADDTCYCQFRTIQGQLIAFNSSWATAVDRRDLLTVQVNGTKGSAVATLRDCFIQPHQCRPRFVWAPDLAQDMDPRSLWTEVHKGEQFENAFKAQWELYLAAVEQNAPFPWNFLSGAQGVLLGEMAYLSAKEERWIDVPELVG